MLERNFPEATYCSTPLINVFNQKSACCEVKLLIMNVLLSESPTYWKSLIFTVLVCLATAVQ